MMATRVRIGVVALLCLTAPVAGPRAAQSTDLVGAEIARWIAEVGNTQRTDALWSQVKPGAQTALVQAQQALAAGRRWFALERLAAARTLLASAMYVGDRPGEVRKSVAAFEHEWTRVGQSLGASLTIPTPDAMRTVSPAAARALAEVAALQIKINYDASLIYGRATDADSGLFYLGTAQAQQQLITFTRSMPSSAGDTRVMRSIGSDADALERTLLSLYQPPASIDRHPEFIGVSAALKEARELDAAGLRYGAWFKFLQATQRLALLRATGAPDVAGLRTRLAAAERVFGTEPGDHSLAQVFVQRAAIELEKPSPEPAGLAAAAAVLDHVVPAYQAAWRAAAPVAPRPEAEVTVRLVRWPFT